MGQCTGQVDAMLPSAEVNRLKNYLLNVNIITPVKTNYYYYIDIILTLMEELFKQNQ